MNYDVDNELELVCLNGSQGSAALRRASCFDVTTSSLTEIARHQLTENVIDIAVDHSKDVEEWCMITQTGNAVLWLIQLIILKANYQGILWSSLPLVGKPTEKALTSVKLLMMKYCYQHRMQCIGSTDWIQLWLWSARRLYSLSLCKIMVWCFGILLASIHHINELLRR